MSNHSARRRLLTPSIYSATRSQLFVWCVGYCSVVVLTCCGRRCGLGSQVGGCSPGAGRGCGSCPGDGPVGAGGIGGCAADGVRLVSAARMTACCVAWCRGRAAGASIEGILDLLAGVVVVAVDAVLVGVVQDAGGVAGPGGDFGGLAGGVEPQGQGGVAQVVGALGEGVAARSGPRAVWRAVCQARP